MTSEEKEAFPDPLEYHLLAVRMVLYTLAESNLRINISKSSFLEEHFAFLGLSWHQQIKLGSKIALSTTLLNDRTDYITGLSFPLSRAELGSKLAICFYYASYVMYIRRIAEIHPYCFNHSDTLSGRSILLIF